MIKNYLPLLLLFLLPKESGAQTSWLAFDSATKVSDGQRVLINPWAGGLNSSQFSKMHLDDDGTEDLVVFDRTTHKISTFLADPNAKTFRYAPAYEARFPVILNWMLLSDFNGDGHKDLFTFTTFGITAYRQVHNGGDWHWEQVKPFLTTIGLSGTPVNLLINSTDIPALTDLDDDGDLDIITFDIEGDYAEFHQNMSMERYGVPDSLEFVRNGICWGNFYKHSCDDFHFGEDCGVKSNPGARVASPQSVLHSGNAILVTDVTGDGRKDLLLGHVSCNNISLLVNEGEKVAANFTKVDSAYPREHPVDFNFFPAVFLEDVDFDGKKDLLASPNTSANDGNLMEFRSSNWYYHNAGTSDRPDFQLVRKDFLQDEMIDVGEHAAPSFFDVDGDGKTDLIIGTGGVRGENGFRGSLWYLQNTGTNNAPAYQIRSRDYLDLSASMTLTRIQPQWADFDGDGIPDLGLASAGSGGLEFRYFPNKGSRNGAVDLNPAQAVAIPLPAGTRITDKVHFYDIDRDGDLDLIIGKSEGNIASYLNTGTPRQPQFTLQTNTLANVSYNFSGRYVSLSVADINLDGQPELLTCDYSGKIKIFHSGKWNEWTKRDSATVRHPFSDTPFSPLLGNFQHVTVADYNGDSKPDLAVGTYGGGIYLFQNILDVEVTGTEPGGELRVQVFPNPAADFVTIESSQDAVMEIYDAGGRALLRDPVTLRSGSPVPQPTGSWPAGLYLIRVSTPGAQITRKVIISR